MPSPASLNFAALGTLANYPSLATGGSGTLTPVNIAPNMGFLVELRIMSNMMNTWGIDLNQARADELNRIMTGTGGL